MRLIQMVRPHQVYLVKHVFPVFRIFFQHFIVLFLSLLLLFIFNELFDADFFLDLELALADSFVVGHAVFFLLLEFMGLVHFVVAVALGLHIWLFDHVLREVEGRAAAGRPCYALGDK